MGWVKKIYTWIKSLVVGEYVKPRLWEWFTAGAVIVSGLVDTIPWFYVTIITINTYIIFRLFRLIRDQQVANHVIKEEEAPEEKLRGMYSHLSELQGYYQQIVKGNTEEFSTQEKMHYSKIEARLMDELDELNISNPRKTFGLGYTFHKKHAPVVLIFLDELVPIAYKKDIEAARKIQINYVEED